MTKLLMALTAFLLTSCAAGFSKDGATYKEYLKDRYDCMKVASGLYCANNGLYTTCMIQRGWHVDADGFKPPKGAEIRMCE